MNRFGFKLLTALLLLAALPALGQYYPMPASASEALRPCTGCPGSNLSSQPNDGLPTYPYKAPIKEHVGRLVDSLQILDYTDGMRTARAGQIEYAPARGTVPSRLYIRLGSTIGAYTTSSFFTTTVPAGMQAVSKIPTGGRYSRNPPERLVLPDAWIYPEAKGSGWKTDQEEHGTDRLREFDFDDRGYVYSAYGPFGLGINRDDGRGGVGQLPFVNQWYSAETPFGPANVFVVKGAGRYYAVIGNEGSANKVAVYDVTNPSNADAATKAQAQIITGKTFGFVRWSKSPDLSKLAIVDGNLDLSIFSSAEYVRGGQSLVTFEAPQGRFSDVAADEDGNFWALVTTGGPSSSARIWKISPSGFSYAKTGEYTFDVPFNPEIIGIGGNILAVAGYDASNADVKLFKMDGSGLNYIPTDNFFQKYYHRSPVGYAMPSSRVFPKAIQPVEVAGKTFLIYNAFGLGDVFELQVGESVVATQVSGGQFYGDEYTFKSESPTSQFPLSVQWTFDNPEAGAANSPAPKQTGQSISYRWSNLTTAGAITAPKQVKVKIINDPDVTDTLVVNLKAPVGRVKVMPADVELTNGAELVLGDLFKDASDGQPAGHYNVWTIGTQTDTLPSTATKSSGVLGTRSVKYVAKYGAQDATNVYSSTVGPYTYTVLPFLATFKDFTSSGNAVTFGATARKTTDPTAFPTAILKWETVWTLKSAGGTDIVPPQTSQDNVGTVSNFVAPDKTLITPNSVLKLTINVLGLPVDVPATYSLTKTLETPTDVDIVFTGCANVGDPCKLKAVPVPSTATPNWDKVQWTVKLGVTTKYTGTGQEVDITGKMNVEGTYTVNVVVSRAIFAKSKDENQIVQPTLCNGPLPTTQNMGIGIIGSQSGCNGSGCTVGESMTFRAEGFGYRIQPCDKFTWSLGDGTSKDGEEVTHTYATAGSKNVKLTVLNQSTGNSTFFTKTVSFGSEPPPPPPPVCDAPTSASIIYAGNQGCGPGVSCKTGEIISFSARKNGVSLQNCDSVLWTFADSTSTSKTATKTFGAPGSQTINLSVTNQNGSISSTPLVIQIVQGTSTPGCSLRPSDRGISITYTGQQSGCTPSSTALCRRGETISFDTEVFNYTPQTCDIFTWDFGDGTPTSNSRTPTHTYAGTASEFSVKLKISNSNGEANLQRVIALEGTPAPATPKITSVAGPSSSGKGSSVTFTATSDIDNTTGWSWNFNDGTAIDNSQAAVVGKTSTITHTFANAGTFVVSASARNAATDANGARGTGTKTITITATPEHRFLLPVVSHIPGQGGSMWITDVQIYNPDPNVSSNPLQLKVTFKGTVKTVTVASSTTILEDFMKEFTTANDAGPMIVTLESSFIPRIWTRTYNKSDAGTFGQYIPAILLSGDGAGGADTEAPKYYLSGLRQDARYRTNLGFVNPTSASMEATVRVYGAENGIAFATFKRTLAPFALDQFGLPSVVTNLPDDEPFSVEVEVPAGKWVIAYASLVDGSTNDPTFLQAVRDGDLASTDFRDIFLPGVGRTGQWRSDVTIFNPDTRGIAFDLMFYDQTGALRKTTPNLQLGALEYLQLDNVLNTSEVNVEGNVVGALRVKANETLSNEHFPLVFARTYFNAPEGSYGQGISGISAKRANVKEGKPALIPAVRSTNDYYTNLGLTNLTNTDVTVKVSILDSGSGAQGLSETYTLKPYQSLVRAPVANVDIIKALSPNSDRASFRVEVVGAGEVWAFASVIDRRTKDPEYIPGIPLQ